MGLKWMPSGGLWLPYASDMHLHAREDEMLIDVLPSTTRFCSTAVCMPNLRSPVVTAMDALNYRASIMRHAPEAFVPQMVLYLTAETTPQMIHEAMEVGVRIMKWMPKGATTNSQQGATIADLPRLRRTFLEMQRLGMILCLHGEVPDPTISYSLRERAFLEVFDELVTNYPNLKMVLEHVSSLDGLQAVHYAPAHVAATITVHHMLLTENDWVGNNHYLCMPVCKSPEDRDALIDIAMSGNPKFFFGSDSAPHPESRKECAHAASGIFSAPVAIEELAMLFGERGKIERLRDFISTFGRRFYGLPPETRQLRLIERPWIVPNKIGTVVPFRSGKEIPISIAP